MDCHAQAIYGISNSKIPLAFGGVFLIDLTYIREREEDSIDMQDLQSIIDDFEFIDDWEDRYRYIIDLGKALPPMSDEEKNDANKVQGCVSQVWLKANISQETDGGPVLQFQGDSDAHIVRGLVAIMLKAYSGATAEHILKTDENDIFSKLGLVEHLTPQRANGLRAMAKRIKHHAEQAS